MTPFLRRLRGDSNRGEGSGAATRLVISGRRGSGPPRPRDEPHPTLMRTPATPLRRAGRLCREACPGRSRYSFVPGSVAIRRSTGSPPQAEGSSLARLTGGAGRRAFPPPPGAPRRGSGGPWDGASAPSPFYLGQRHADPVRPPTHRRGAARCTTADGNCGSGRRPIKATGCRGCGPGRPRRTRGPVTAGCHHQGLAPSAPVRPRLAGRPAAQRLTKRLTSKTSLVCSMW